MSTTPTATVHSAVYDALADWEVGFATAHLANGAWQREPGRFRVVTVGATREPITTMGGLRITPDVTLDELSPSDSAMLILPGADAFAAGGLTEFTRTAREFLDAGTPVAAICGATFGLAAEGLLDERRHTSNAAEFLQASKYAGGALYQDAPAVTDGDLITASGVHPVEFAREVMGRLDAYEPHVLDAWYRLYSTGDASAYFELDGAGAA
jgi:putative intracellular protease/amidase